MAEHARRLSQTQTLTLETKLTPLWPSMLGVCLRPLHRKLTHLMGAQFLIGEAGSGLEEEARRSVDIMERVMQRFARTKRRSV